VGGAWSIEVVVVMRMDGAMLSSPSAGAAGSDDCEEGLEVSMLVLFEGDGPGRRAQLMKPAALALGRRQIKKASASRRQGGLCLCRYS
jgi:hypothetical protein